MNKEKPVAIVLGSSPTGLYAVRELADSGFSVALADINRGCAWFSRHVSGGRFIGGVEAALDWAKDLVKQRDTPAVLVPTSDAFVEAVAQRHDNLSDRFRLFGVYSGLSSQLLDKLSFWALCQEHGIDTPRVWKVDSTHDIQALIDELPFPCILKPELIHRARSILSGKKVLQVRRPEALVELLASLPVDVGGWLIQEIIPGPESEITLVGASFGQNGQLLQKFSGRKLRQYPPGFGSASLVTASRCEESEKLAVDFLKDLGFRGICGVEFKRDPRNGRLQMIEINPRPTLWFQISRDAGMSLVSCACADLCELSQAPANSQATSVVWRYLVKDFAAARFYRRDSDELPFGPPDVSSSRTMRKRSWPVFRTSDPLPSLAEPLGYLKKAWQRSK